jgi:hypothetical protein
MEISLDASLVLMMIGLSCWMLGSLQLNLPYNSFLPAAHTLYLDTELDDPNIGAVVQPRLRWIRRKITTDSGRSRDDAETSPLWKTKAVINIQN